MSLAQLLVVVCPFILFSYPAAAAFVGTSEFPAFLEKYSYGAAAFNVVTILLFATFAAALFRRALGFAALATIALVFLKLRPASNSVLVLPGALALAATRLAASISLIGIAFIGSRSGNRKATPMALAVGACFLISSIIDTAFLVSGDLRSRGNHQHRSWLPPETDDLSKVTDRDIVSFGDFLRVGARASRSISASAMCCRRNCAKPIQR